MTEIVIYWDSVFIGVLATILIIMAVGFITILADK
jgi:hypothetical protein